MNFSTYIIKALILFSINFAVASPAPIENKIDAVSALYLGTPYLVDPLGEEAGYDKDPLYRFDGFDCVTYVETVLALALSHNNDEFLELIKEIRYKYGKVDFMFRNHFTSVDWIINNERNGLLNDVTRKLFGKNTQISKTLINKARWFEKFHKMNVDLEPQISKLDYLPLTTVLKSPELLQKIHSGSIINIVRSGWLDISHQGFAIIKNNGVLYFRQASSTQRKVTEVPLYNYLKRLKKIKTVKGINVLQVRN